MAEFLQITTTASDREVVGRLAAELVNRRLAACVQVTGPVTSTYVWEGKVETAKEWVCTAKTRADRFEEAADLIASLHPYGVPEIIATEIAAASEPYAAWLRSELS